MTQDSAHFKFRPCVRLLSPMLVPEADYLGVTSARERRRLRKRVGAQSAMTLALLPLSTLVMVFTHGWVVPTSRSPVSIATVMSTKGSYDTPYLEMLDMSRKAAGYMVDVEDTSQQTRDTTKAVLQEAKTPHLEQMRDNENQRQAAPDTLPEISYWGAPAPGLPSATEYLSTLSRAPAAVSSGGKVGQSKDYLSSIENGKGVRSSPLTFSPQTYLSALVQRKSSPSPNKDSAVDTGAAKKQQQRRFAFLSLPSLDFSRRSEPLGRLRSSISKCRSVFRAAVRRPPKLPAQTVIIDYGFTNDPITSTPVTILKNKRSVFAFVIRPLQQALFSATRKVVSPASPLRGWFARVRSMMSLRRGQR